MTKKQKVLFLCTANSARSQMAEALLKHKAGELFDVYSAGTHPEIVDQRAIDALQKIAIEVSNPISKHVNEFAKQQFDYVITLCESANSLYLDNSNALKRLNWDLPDPKSRPGYTPFDTTLNDLNYRLDMFLLVEKDKTSKDSVIKDKDVSSSNFDSIAFYKSLTDLIRLKTLMLTHYHGELCVCELMQAMEVESQPKVSRNLAVLKRNQLLIDRKHGQWVFYRLNPNLPLWVKSVIALTTENNIGMINNELQRINQMSNRPDKSSFCK